MTNFTNLEVAALRSIFSETPDLEADLNRQLDAAIVIQRENSGGGFFTTISVANSAPKLSSSSVLGCETQARVDGLQYGLGFVLFIKRGMLHMLEGFAWGPETTASFDLSHMSFEIYRQAVRQIS